jgi:hypothetical protein
MGPFADLATGNPDGGFGGGGLPPFTSGPANALVASRMPAPEAAGNAGSPAIQMPLRNAIVHAAQLADTPEKWSGFISMLRANGIDPGGYEDFDEGRAKALALL